MRNKGVSPVGKIVSVARSKPALVTRYRPRMIGHDLLPLPSHPSSPFTPTPGHHVKRPAPSQDREEERGALSPDRRGKGCKEISSLLKVSTAARV